MDGDTVKIFCRHCGAALQPEAKFCTSCGQSTQIGPQASPVQNNAFSTVNLVYVLYLLGLITFGLTSLVGGYFAYTNKSSSDAVLKSHYDYQWDSFVRIFLPAMALFFVSSVLSSVFIGFAFSAYVLAGLIALIAGFISLISFAIGVYFLVRSLLGIVIAQRGAPIQGPVGWGLPKV